jgi:preprotein translocase subunit SecF
MKIIKYKNIFIAISSFLVIASIIAMFIFGFKLGIDFKGGTAIEIAWSQNMPTTEAIKSLALENKDIPEVTIQPIGGNGYQLKMREINPSEREILTNQILSSFPGAELKGYTTIGPSVGRELSRKALLAIILVSLGIVIFIAVSFRKVSYPVKSWKYGVIAIATLLHDVIIPTGIFVVLSSIYNIEIDTLFVVSILTILGLSVSDTIVVFDRIRENLKITKNLSFGEVVGKSINEVYARSISTSVTTLIALAALAVWGPVSTRLLAIMLGAGMFFGTYSSIFLASPLLVTWQEYQDKKALKTKN